MMDTALTRGGRGRGAVRGRRGGSAADGSPVGGADESGVLREHAGAIPGRRRDPPGCALGQLIAVHEQFQRAGDHVQSDAVTVLHEGDRAALGRLRRDVADAQAGGAT